MAQVQCSDKFALLKCTIALFFLISVPLKPSTFDYIYPHHSIPSFSNFGTVGLIQMPTARMHSAGTVGFTWSHNDPYINGSIIAYPFSFLEAAYSYTDINNALYSDNVAFSGKQTYKDKGFDFKLRLLKERRFFPVISAGFRDFAGTGIFSSEYIVATKNINNLDFTFGMGWGIFDQNRVKNPFIYVSEKFNDRSKSGNTQGGEFDLNTMFSGPAGLFGGIEYILPNVNGARLTVEYDGTNYQKEGFPFGRKSFKYAFESVKQPDSKINFGFTYPVNKHLQLKLNYVKGNTINFGFSLHGSFGGKNPVVKKRDPIKKISNQKEYKYVSGLDDLYLYRNTLRFLDENKLNIQKADLTNSTYSIQYSQSTHASHLRASGRVATILDQITPDHVKKFVITNVNAGMPMNTVTIDRDKFTRYQQDPIPVLGVKALDLKPADNNRVYKYNPSTDFPKIFWKIAPQVRSQIGGPDGFYFGDLRIQANSETVFSKNLTFLASASFGVYDTFGQIQLSSDSILPHVRTDIVKYLQQSSDYNVKRAQLNWFNSLGVNVYSKISAGLLEEMFGGIGGEVLYRPFYKNYAIGAELWRVRQRDYEMLFKFREYETTTGHINLYLMEPRSQVLIALKGGRFLAGDSGINFDFSRRFKSGLRIGAFFSKTDISKREFGEGSFDKGFYFHLPIEMFFESYSKVNTSWGLRPLTRDGASYLNHSHHLWGVTEQAQIINFNRDFDDLYD
ncbi:YjbH domain-containing protein [Pseudomonadota bacterium]|nr:YjbH domain-containing protein [Pseudomonadota bacterium]